MGHSQEQHEGLRCLVLDKDLPDASVHEVILSNLNEYISGR